MSLIGILESFDLNQHANFPNHIHGHSLDVMIFSKGCDVLSVFLITFLLWLI